MKPTVGQESTKSKAISQNVTPKRTVKDKVETQKTTKTQPQKSNKVSPRTKARDQKESLNNTGSDFARKYELIKAGLQDDDTKEMHDRESVEGEVAGSSS